MFNLSWFKSEYHYTVYITINLVNGKYYYGKHKTLNLDDSYLGSGIHIEQAVKLYGKENFIKIVLFDFNNYYEMDQKEIEIISQDIVDDDYCYNHKLGGDGGATWTGRVMTQEHKDKISKANKGKQRPTKGRKLTDLHKEKIKNAQKGRPTGRVPWNKGLTKDDDERIRVQAENQIGKIITEEMRRKISEKNKGRDNGLRGKKLDPERIERIRQSSSNITDDTRQKMRDARKGKKQTEEVKQKISDALKGKKKKPFSEEHKINIGKASKGRIPPNKGKKMSPEVCEKMKEGKRKAKIRRETIG